MQPTWIAEEEVVFVRADGHRSPGRIVVSAPVSKGTEWSCDVALEGLERTYTIHGASSLQALLLGVRFLGARLHDVIAKGGKVLSPSTGDEGEQDLELPLRATFGALLRAPRPSRAVQRAMQRLTKAATPKATRAAAKTRGPRSRSPSRKRPR